jgi:hypothetical protein
MSPAVLLRSKMVYARESANVLRRRSVGEYELAVSRSRVFAYPLHQPTSRNRSRAHAALANVARRLRSCTLVRSKCLSRAGRDGRMILSADRKLLLLSPAQRDASFRQSIAAVPVFTVCNISITCVAPRSPTAYRPAGQASRRWLGCRAEGQLLLSFCDLLSVIQRVPVTSQISVG